jgi:proteic killer suppression protein
MTESIRHRGLRRLYERGDRSGIGPAIVPRAEEVLSMLDAAESVEELDLPGYRLHALVGSLKGYSSIRVTGNWRIIFRFDGSSVVDVDLVDYH